MANEKSINVAGNKVIIGKSPKKKRVEQLKASAKKGSANVRIEAKLDLIIESLKIDV